MQVFLGTFHRKGKGPTPGAWVVVASSQRSALNVLLEEYPNTSEEEWILTTALNMSVPTAYYINQPIITDRDTPFFAVRGQ